MKIDIHTHILPPSIPSFKEKFGYGGFLKYQSCSDGCDVDLYDDKGKFFRRIKPNCMDPEVRIHEMGETGVQLQVLSTLPAMFSYWAKGDDGLVVAQFLNDHIAKVVQSRPQNFIGLGTVPLQSVSLACREAERCVSELNLHGFQIGSHVNDKNLCDPSFDEFYRTCEKLGAVLFVHPWDMMGQERMPKYWLPWLVGMPAETSLAICSMMFGGVFRKFPRLKVAFAHGGGSFPFIYGRIKKGFECRPDLCAVDNDVHPKEYLGHFYLDSLVHDISALEYLIELVGANRVCLGSDYPFPLGEDRPGQLIEKLNVDEETRAWIRYKSAAEWLSLNLEKYKF